MRYIKFYSPTCQPCKVADLVLDDKGIEFESVDVTEEMELPTKYGIISVPTVVLTDDLGNEIERAVGLSEIQKL